MIKKKPKDSANKEESAVTPVNQATEIHTQYNKRD
jgi:hypothetical protein